MCIRDRPEAAVGVGFGPACNQGARAGQADFILFLNPDTVLHDDTLIGAVAALEADSRNAVVGIRLQEPSGTTQRSCARFPTLTSLLMRSTGLDRMPGLAPFGYPMREWDHAESRDVDHVIGAFYLVRRDVFEQVQGFDERFFVSVSYTHLTLPTSFLV